MDAILSPVWITAALQEGGISVWVWIILILIIVVLLLWWLGRQEERGGERGETPVTRVESAEPPVVATRGELPPLESVPLTETTPEVVETVETKTVQTFAPEADDLKVDEQEAEATVEAIEEAPGTGAFEFAPPEAPPAEPVPGPQEGFPDLGVEKAGPAQLEDLEIIEGIGPKIASVLRAAGVDTYAQLAAMQPAEIADILHAAGLRLFDARTWPEQARLAMEGKWDEFKALTDSLRGGRRA